MRVQQTTIGPVMLTLVGRQQLGLKYIVPVTSGECTPWRERPAGMVLAPGEELT